MKKLAEYTKAIVAAVTAGAASYYAFNVDGHVTGDEWKTVAVATLVALVTTWGSPNVPAPAPAPLEPSVPEDSLPDAVL